MTSFSALAPEGQPTGQQWTISRGGDVLTVVEVGGGLRSWSRGGVDVVAGYPADATVVAGRGQQLIPWPNRVADGRWSFDGVDHQLPLTEPKLHNASHGLVRWASWGLGDLGEHHVTLTHRLHPQPGWDWVLDLATTYTLTEAGLEVTTSAVNRSSTRAPYGYGAHPYLHVGDTPSTTSRSPCPARASSRSLPTGSCRSRPTGSTARPTTSGVGACSVRPTSTPPSPTSRAVGTAVGRRGSTGSRWAP